MAWQVVQRHGHHGHARPPRRPRNASRERASSGNGERDPDGAPSTRGRLRRSSSTPGSGKATPRPNARGNTLEENHQVPPAGGARSEPQEARSTGGGLS
uniref:Uncharacterized protein n=1 Tax=Arundo donax TaxID=35708 RepID=A0A0A8YG33_ARUDO